MDDSPVELRHLQFSMTVLIQINKSVLNEVYFSQD